MKTVVMRKPHTFTGHMLSARRHASHSGYKDKSGIILTFKFPSRSKHEGRDT